MRIRTGFVSNSSSSSFVYVLKSRCPNLEGVDWKKVETTYNDHSMEDYDHKYGFDVGEEPDVDSPPVITEDMSMDDLMQVLLSEEQSSKSRIMGDTESEEPSKDIAKMFAVFFKNVDVIYKTLDLPLYMSLEKVVIPYLEETNQISAIAGVEMDSYDAGSMHFRTLEEIEELFDKDDDCDNIIF